MKAINFWDIMSQQMKEVNLSSFRCLDVVKQIPLYEVNNYNGYYDFAKEVYEIQSDEFMTKWKMAMSHSSHGYCDCSDDYLRQSIKLNDITTSPTNLKSNHHYYTYNLQTGKDILDYERIVELGGGVGDMAKFIRHMGFKGKYTIIDLPEVLNIQKYNLEGYNINLTTIPPEYQKNTLFISTWALSECPMDWRENVIEILKPENYLITYQSNFEELDNESYFSEWEGIRIDIPWIAWDGGSKYLLK